MNKKVFACLLAVVMLLGLIMVPAAVKAEGEEPEKEIVILYTNDVHCGVTDGIGYVGVARATLSRVTSSVPSARAKPSWSS